MFLCQFGHCKAQSAGAKYLQLYRDPEDAAAAIHT
jgi:hypothetical protein